MRGGVEEGRGKRLLTIIDSIQLWTSTSMSATFTTHKYSLLIMLTNMLVRPPTGVQHTKYKHQ